jgi:hypothetical protein
MAQREQSRAEQSRAEHSKGRFLCRASRDLVNASIDAFHNPATKHNEFGDGMVFKANVPYI